MIQHIRIQNYRSLVDVSLDLEPLTVLIGRSGTGKTNFVSAIRMLRDLLTYRHGVHDVFEKVEARIRPLTQPTGDLGFCVELQIPRLTDRLRYEIAFSGRTLSLERLTSGSEVIYHQGLRKGGWEWVVKPRVEPLPPQGQIALGRLSRLRPAMITHVALTSGIGCYDFPGNVAHSTKGGNDGTAGLADDGSNILATATSIVQNLHQLEDWSSVADSLRSVNPAVRQVSLNEPERNRLDVSHEVAGKLLTLDVAQESEGFRRFLAHMLALYQTPSKQTVIFEHPEHAIHPGAMTALFEEFQGYVRAGRGQVILTTHSPQLLDHFAPEQIRVVDIENQETRIGPLAPEQVQSVRDKLLLPGELLTVDPARLPGQLAEVPG